MGKRNVNIPNEELIRLYEKEKLPVSEIANKFKCTKNTVAYWIRKYKIKRRTPSECMKLFVNKKEVEIPKEKLIELYVKKNLDRDKIAKIYGCKIVTVTKLLKKHKIKIRRSRGINVIISKKEMKNLYEKRKLTTYQIAEIYNCCQATVWKRLKKFGIKARKPYCLFAKIPSKEELVRFYVNGNMSTWEIEKKYGYSRGTVHKHLKKYNLIRSRSGAHIRYKRKNFSGDLIEKSYMIGFRLGDLRVRKIWENSETIHIDCGSTKKEQIDLIRNLFQEYGRVWISKPTRKGRIQIEAHLNDSFSFLLEKKVPRWIIRDEKCFFSFLAGFTDADGCISVSKNKAYYSLGNYDNKLLFLIRDKLREFGIESLGPYECDTSNYIGFDGYGHNQNYWILSVSRKKHLLELLNNTEQYIKHKKKIRDLDRAKKNILERNKKFESGDLRYRMR